MRTIGLKLHTIALMTLHRVVLAYLTGDQTLREVEQWLVAHLQQCLDTHDALTMFVVNAIDGLIVEYHERLITEEEMKVCLLRLICLSGVLTTMTGTRSVVKTISYQGSDIRQ